MSGRLLTPFNSPLLPQESRASSATRSGYEAPLPGTTCEGATTQRLVATSCKASSTIRSSNKSSRYSVTRSRRQTRRRGLSDGNRLGSCTTRARSPHLKRTSRMARVESRNRRRSWLKRSWWATVSASRVCLTTTSSTRSFSS